MPTVDAERRPPHAARVTEPSNTPSDMKLFDTIAGMGHEQLVI